MQPNAHRGGLRHPHRTYLTALALLVGGLVGSQTLSQRTATNQLAPASVHRVDNATAALPPADEILLDLRDDVTAEDIVDLEKQLGAHLELNSPDVVDSKLYVAPVNPAAQASILSRLSADPRVESAEPNAWMQGTWNDADRAILQKIPFLQPSRAPQAKSRSAELRPNDPLYPYQWHMQKINMERAWTITQGRGAIVAVIDTGVAYEDHDAFIQVEDLKSTSFVPGFNYLTNDGHANDDQGHGTHVAGTIAQSTNNGVGVTGVAPGASIMPLKVLNSRGLGKVSDIAAAIRFAANHGANVINLSLGGSSPSKALESACKAAHSRGVVIVCAAGNSKASDATYPARYPQCIAVSATRYDDALTFYTNRGKRIDIAAPGGDLNVDQNNDGYKDGVLQNTIGPSDPSSQTYGNYQGTSMAAPHVAGTAALLVSLGITDPEAIRALLVSSARKEGLGDRSAGYGGGVLDAAAATYAASTTLPRERLLLALLLLAGAWAFSTIRPQVTVPLICGLVLGSSGFYWLVSLLGTTAQGPMLAPLVHPLPDWDLFLSSASNHANPFFWSALIPFAASMVTFGHSRAQSWSLGLCIGSAAFLLHQALWATADIVVFPGWILDKAWLLTNFAACLVLTYILIHSRERRNPDLGA